MPARLKDPPRHADISTTLRFHVDQQADDVAADLWAMEKAGAGTHGHDTSVDTDEG